MRSMKRKSFRTNLVDVSNGMRKTVFPDIASKTPTLTGIMIRQRFLLKVLEKIWTELLLQTVTVKPEQTLDTIPAQREKQRKIVRF